MEVAVLSFTNNLYVFQDEYRSKALLLPDEFTMTLLGNYLLIYSILAVCVSATWAQGEQKRTV